MKSRTHSLKSKVSPGRAIQTRARLPSSRLVSDISGSIAAEYSAAGSKISVCVNLTVHNACKLMLPNYSYF
jgi:hypothetical protein